MDQKQAIDYCREHTAEILGWSKARHKGYICPICGQGTTHGYGLQQGTVNKYHFTCPECDGMGAGAGGDVFDWAARMYGLQPNSRECFQYVFELAGLQVEGSQQQERTKTAKAEDVFQPAAPAAAPAAPAQPMDDYTSFLQAAAARAGETDYFNRRGLSAETVQHFAFGYVPDWVHPTLQAQGKKGYPTPRAIIPVSNGCYLARDTRTNIPEEQKGYAKQKAGSIIGLFNQAEALADKRGVIIVVEGEIDAASIWQVGGNAIGMCSTANKQKVIDLIKRYPRKKWVLALDNDSTGEKTTEEIRQALAELTKEGKTELYSVKLYRKCKDANELLQMNAETLRKDVAEVMTDPAGTDYKQSSDEAALMSFWEHATDPERGRCYPTGFSDLDNALGGGIFAGLYVLGAISSLGKTTFVLQLANNLAKQGTDVLFFSLEMARDELIAKSISRFTALYALRDDRIGDALTQRQVMSGTQYSRLSKQQHQYLLDALTEYGAISKNIFTVEGNFDYSVEDMARRIERHIKARGKKPVVFVDYLQIMGLDDEKGRRSYTDKQKADKIVSTLKRISRLMNVPIIVISSFNRESYTQPVSMSSFKESGGIEYSCDVLIGLQYRGMDYDAKVDDDMDNKKGKQSRYKRIMMLLQNIQGSVAAGMPAPVQCKLLKNRNGARGQSVYFDFFPRYNLYSPSGKVMNVFKEFKELNAGKDYSAASCPQAVQEELALQQPKK